MRMGKINVLSLEVANLIAAGEVVDRPASVLKELLENAIDAGADAITAEIKNGGASFIRVSDNGCGIAAEDLPVAVRRHATSKIAEAKDLDSIFTLGFRGEALAAIAAVSNLRIISKTKDAPCGTRLESRAGTVVEIAETGCPDGTTVIVENLFANVPARRKFLKRDASETMAATAAFEKIALSHPEISFKLIVDGAVKLSTVGDGNLYNTIFALLGREFAGRLIAVNGESDGIRISGFVGTSDNVRANRNYQNFFINSRYVKSRTAMAALEQAFRSYIAPEKFPVCVLYIELNPAAVDVNVHPAKLEVKFSNEKPVFDAIYYAVRSALESSAKKPELTLKSSPAAAEEKPRAGAVRQGGSALGAFLPVLERGERRSEQIRLTPPPVLTFGTPVPADVIRMAPPSLGGAETPLTESELAFLEAYDARKGGGGAPDSAKSKPGRGLDIDFESVADTLKELQPAANEQADRPREGTPETGAAESAGAKEAAGPDEAPEGQPIPVYRIVGEVFHCYVLVQTEEKLLIIDKHAAHERILFEELRAAMKKAGQASQVLLLPLPVALSPEELAAAEEYRAEIAATGFDYTVNPDTKSVQIHRLPDRILPKDAGDVFVTIVSRLAEGTGNAAITREILYEQALYQAACKAALKAGRIDAPEHIAWLCDTLMKMPDITVCPHGRPVMIELSKRYLDRQFSRG